MDCETPHTADKSPAKLGKNYNKNQKRKAKQKLRQLQQSSTAKSLRPSQGCNSCQELWAKCIRLEQHAKLCKTLLDRQTNDNKNLKIRNEKLNRQLVKATLRQGESVTLPKKRSYEYRDPINTTEEAASHLRKLAKNNAPGAREYVDKLRQEAKDRVTQWRSNTQLPALAQKAGKSVEPPKPVICPWTGVVLKPLRLPGENNATSAPDRECSDDKGTTGPP